MKYIIKKEFFKKLEQVITADDYFLTADLGFGLLEPIREKLGKHFINVGISEQAMIGIASGIALSGCRVFTYTISSFYMRALEQIKLDIYGQKVDNVIMIGSGTSKSGYKNYGLSHKIDGRDLNSLNGYIPTYEIEHMHELGLFPKLISGDSKLILLPR